MATHGQEPELRERAIARLKQKADFSRHLVVYVLFNGLLMVIWAITSRGFFWPVFPLGLWGIGVFFHAWDTFGRPGFSEEQIRREIEHLR